MGIKDWFAGWFEKMPEGLSTIQAPSPEYPTSRSAIEAMLRAHPYIGKYGNWITFKAEAAGKSATIELWGDRLNFCKVEVDLSALLQSCGLNALAEYACPGGRKQNDRTCWTISNPTVEELTQVVDAAFVKTFGLGDSYAIIADYWD